MTVAAHRAPNGDERLRIAITSPDILAQIRHVFADKNLVVDIVGMPYVEVAVRPAGTARAGRAAGRPAANGTADTTVASKRLRAEYQLSVIRAGEDRPEARRRQPEPLRHPDARDRVLSLSWRQREVLALMARGARNAEIAATLHVTEKTVKNHVNRIFRELGVDGRVEAVLLWQRCQADALGQQDVEAQ